MHKNSFFLFLLSLLFTECSIAKKGIIESNQEQAIKYSKLINKNDLKIVDLTGAGDLFAAGYLHGYLNNFSQNDCLDKGTEMASKIIQQIGARL